MLDVLVPSSTTGITEDTSWFIVDRTAGQQEVCNMEIYRQLCEDAQRNTQVSAAQHAASVKFVALTFVPADAQQLGLPVSSFGPCDRTWLACMRMQWRLRMKNSQTMPSAIVQFMSPTILPVTGDVYWGGTYSTTSHGAYEYFVRPYFGRKDRQNINRIYAIDCDKSPVFQFTANRLAEEIAFVATGATRRLVSMARPSMPEFYFGFMNEPIFEQYVIQPYLRRDTLASKQFKGSWEEFVQSVGLQAATDAAYETFKAAWHDDDGVLFAPAKYYRRVDDPALYTVHPMTGKPAEEVQHTWRPYPQGIALVPPPVMPHNELFFMKFKGGDLSSEVRPNPAMAFLRHINFLPSGIQSQWDITKPVLTRLHNRLAEVDDMEAMLLDFRDWLPITLRCYASDCELEDALRNPNQAFATSRLPSVQVAPVLTGEPSQETLTFQYEWGMLDAFSLLPQCRQYLEGFAKYDKPKVLRIQKAQRKQARRAEAEAGKDEGNAAGPAGSN